MNIRTFAVLFTCTAIPLFIGIGLFPLLPLYAAQFGATPTAIGIFYAVVYIASAASIIGVGWLAERLSRRGLFLTIAVLGPVAVALLGHATALWQVVALTAVVWMCGTTSLTLLNVFTGILAEPTRRGRVFALMSLVYPLDALAGGAVVGQLTSVYGYTVMFYALAAIWAVQPVTGFLGLHDPRIVGPAFQDGVRTVTAPLGKPFALLLISALLSLACTSVGRLGTSLAMQGLGFGPGAVASTVTVAGLVTIPLTLGVSALSDRLGRRPTLVLSTLLGAAGAATLIGAASMWHFWLAASLLLAGWCVGRAVSSALASDLLAPETLGRGLAWLGAMDAIAGIVGFAVTGYAMETLGTPLLFAAATGLGLLAVFVLAGLPRATWAEGWPSIKRRAQKTSDRRVTR